MVYAAVSIRPVSIFIVAPATLVLVPEFTILIGPEHLAQDVRENFGFWA